MNDDSVYLWGVLERSSQKLVGECLKDNIQDRFIYKQGVEIKESIITPTVIFNDTTINKLKRFSCLESNIMVPIIDAKISTILSRLAAHQIQLMDVIIKAKDGELKGYKIPNVTHECDGLLNEEKTVYNYIPSTKHIFGFKKFEYKKACLNEMKTVRNKIYHGHLLVSLQVKKSLEAIENLGINFVKVSG